MFGVEVNDPEFVRSPLWDGPTVRDRADTLHARGGAWSEADAQQLLLAATAHRWRTRWVAAGRA